MRALFEKPRLRNARDDPANPKDGYVLEIKGSDSQLFQDWAQQQTDEELCQYFRSVAEGIEERKLEHYHFKLCNGRWNPRLGRYDQNWHIDIYYGEEDSPKEGPLQVSRCMSCDLDCPLIIGVLGEAAAASPSPALAAAAAAPNSAPPPPPPPAAAAAAPANGLPHASEQPSNSSAGSAEAVDCAAEGSASPGAAVKLLVAADSPRDTQQAASVQRESTVAGETVESAETDGLQQQQQQQSGPVSRDSLVKETEHCRVWWDAKARPMWVVTPKQHLERLADLSQAQLVDLFKAALGVVKEMGCRSFETMILNHGDSRNHAHLHLKVRIFWKEFASIRAHLPPRPKGQLAALEQFRDQLPPEARGTRAAWQLRQQVRQREHYQREQNQRQRC